MTRSAEVLVSVIIPTRDRLAYLKEAVASVQAQSIPDWELLVVDDASEDGTAAWLGTLVDPRIRTIRLNTHRHRAAARNVGLEEASGRYVIFLDDDDLFRARALEVLSNSLASYVHVGAACGGTVTFDEEGHRRTDPHVVREQVRVVWPEIIVGWIAGTGQVMYRTDALRSIGGWDESITALQDWELSLRSSRLGPVVLHPYIVREYRRHRGQWYPHDHLVARDRVLEAFIRTLPEAERCVARGALLTRNLLEAARERLHVRGQPREALRLFVKAYRVSPWLLRSPLLRASYARGVTQAFVGAIGGSATHRALESGRRLALRVLRRAPASSFRRRSEEEPTFRAD